tara:strand:- start:315 stop:419 length:105 start_codon:yes stop_codon:yes gene_type:complete
MEEEEEVIKQIQNQKIYISLEPTMLDIVLTNETQ